MSISLPVPLPVPPIEEAAAASAGPNPVPARTGAAAAGKLFVALLGRALAECREASAQVNGEPPVALLGDAAAREESGGEPSASGANDPAGSSPAGCYGPSPHLAGIPAASDSPAAACPASAAGFAGRADPDASRFPPAAGEALRREMSAGTPLESGAVLSPQPELPLRGLFSIFGRGLPSAGTGPLPHSPEHDAPDEGYTAPGGAAGRETAPVQRTPGHRSPADPIQPGHLPAPPGESATARSGGGASPPPGQSGPPGKPDLGSAGREDLPVVREVFQQPEAFREGRILNFPEISRAIAGTRLPEEALSAVQAAPGAAGLKHPSAGTETSAAAPLPRPGAEMPPVNARENLLEQLSARVVYLRERGEFPAEMRLYLKPPALGEIVVRVAAAQGRVAVQFVAAAPARELLQSCLGELRLRLEQAGLTLAGLDLHAPEPPAAGFGDGRSGQGGFSFAHPGKSQEIPRPAATPQSVEPRPGDGRPAWGNIIYWA